MWKDEVVLKLKDKVLEALRKASKDAVLSVDQIMNDANWERVYFKADKFSGSLRYTTSK
jgi:hypothetical protein